MNRPAKRDLVYLRSAAINPTGRTFINYDSEVWDKCKANGWLAPTLYQHVAEITANGRVALQSMEEME